RATQPPPGDRTMPPASLSSTVRWCSSSRKYGSPCCAKICAMVIPSRREISLSKSRNWRLSWRPSSNPTVLLPEPGSPIRTICGTDGSAVEPGCEVRKVCMKVSLDFGERVAAEFFEHCVAEHQSSHRLRNHPHCRNRGHIAALGSRFGRFAGRHVDRAKRAHEGANWLHANA